MPDPTPATPEESNTPEGQEPKESQETPSEGEAGKEKDETDQDANQKESEKEVPPEVLREKLTKANSEAANYRTKVRELEKRLEGAKSEEDIAAIREEMKTERETSERALVVENVALKFELPEELQAVLQGKTREELEAHAKVLQKFVPSPKEVEPDDVSGGLDPSDKDGAFDAVAESRKARARRY